MSKGSGFPAVKDTVSNFDEPAEGSAILNANIPNEMASSVEAIQQTVGTDPLDLSGIGNSTTFANVAEMLRDLCRIEIGETGTWSNAVTPEASKAITTTSGRFTDLTNIVVFLQGFGQYQPNNGTRRIELFTVYDLRSLSGGNFTFDIYRRTTDSAGDIVGGSYTGTATVKWLAFEWPY